MIETTITMPRWVHDDLTSKLGKQWQNYYQALYNHELGHRDIALSALKELEAAGRKYETSDKCDVIGEDFKPVYRSILEKYKQLEHNYDLETDHGKKSGAVFP